MMIARVVLCEEPTDGLDFAFKSDDPEASSGKSPAVSQRGIMEGRQSEDREETREAFDTGGPPCGESQADGVPCEEMGNDCEDCDQAEPEAREVYKSRGDRS